jgi:hypothetical protein
VYRYCTGRRCHRVLEEAKLWLQVPASVRSVLEDTRLGGRSENSEHQEIRRLRESPITIIANNKTPQLDAAEVEAGRLGLTALRLRHPNDERSPEISGEARAAGQAIARATRGSGPLPSLLFGGETTVTLPDASGQGGRCQELALAAALELEELGMNDITLLAAGTDGRDGPTGRRRRCRRRKHGPSSFVPPESIPSDVSNSTTRNLPWDAVGGLLRIGTDRDQRSRMWSLRFERLVSPAKAPRGDRGGHAVDAVQQEVTISCSNPRCCFQPRAAALHRVLREELLQDWNPSTMDADPLPA